MKVLYKKSKDGSLNAFITSEKGSWHLHSLFSPKKEAQRLVSSVSDRANIVVVLGNGLGYHVEELLKRDEIEHIVVVEYLDEFKKYIPKDHKIIFYEDFFLRFEFINPVDIKGVSFLEHKPSIRLNPNFYKKAKDEITAFINSKIGDLFTRIEFERLWIVNSIRNIPKIFSHSSLKRVFGKFDNVGMIIVSAGPSLYKHLDELKKVKDFVLIASTDTAYPALLEYGISPHFVMSLDAQFHSIYHFFKISPVGFLISDVVAYPGVSNKFIERTFFSGTIKIFDNVVEKTPFSSWIEEHLCSIGYLQCGGSVATSLFDLGINLGVRFIALLGQDLAYINYQTHSKGTHHLVSWYKRYNRFSSFSHMFLNVVKKRMIVFKDDEVVSDFSMWMYKRWFEDAIKKVNFEVYNVGSNGLNIDGAHRIKSIDELPIVGIKENLFDVLKKLYVPCNSELSKLRDILKDFLSYLYKMKRRRFSSIDEIKDDFLKSGILELIVSFKRRGIIDEKLLNEKLTFWIDRLLFEVKKILGGNL